MRATGRVVCALLVAAAWCAAPAARAEEDAAAELGVPSMDVDVGATAAADGAGGWVFGFDATPIAPGGGYAPDCRAKPDRGYLGVRTAAGRWRRIAVEPELDGGPVVTAGRAAFLVATRNCREFSAEPQAISSLRRLRLLRGRVGQRPRATVRISDRAEAFGSELAARAGRLAVAWLEPTGSGFHAYDVSRLRVGRMAGALGPELRLPGAFAEIAWVSDNRLLVLYQAVGGLHYREWTPRGGLGRARFLSATQSALAFTLTLGPRGGGLAAWGSQSHGIDPDSPWVVQAAWLRRGDTRFGRVQTLERPARIDDGGLVSASIGDDGVGTAAWTSSRPGNPVVAAAARPGGRFHPQQLAPASSLFVSATRVGGGAVVQWYADRQLTEAARPPGSTTFGPPAAASRRRDLVYGAVRADSRLG